MARMTPAFVLAGLVAGTALPLWAAEPALAPERVAKMVQRADTDGDGRISRAESLARRSGHFARMDADGDGAVTSAELAAAHAARPDGSAKPDRAERAPKRFAAMDANGDGRVTIAEFEGRAADRFGRIDADGDGYLTVAEIAAWRPGAGQN